MSEEVVESESGLKDQVIGFKSGCRRNIDGVAFVGLLLVVGRISVGEKGIVRISSPSSFR